MGAKLETPSVELLRKAPKMSVAFLNQAPTLLFSMVKIKFCDI